jgi:hypothetical protein
MTKRNTALTIEDSIPGSNDILIIEQQIRQRAFELYEQRGRADGLDEQDWLEAEAEILHGSAMKAAA